jgi:hypothetical protein
MSSGLQLIVARFYRDDAIVESVLDVIDAVAHWTGTIVGNPTQAQAKNLALICGDATALAQHDGGPEDRDYVLATQTLATVGLRVPSSADAPTKWSLVALAMLLRVSPDNYYYVDR